VSLVETLRWLVDIPSETGDELEIRQAITDRLSSIPMVKTGKSAVVGERSGKPLILLVGHLDTVPSQGQGPARVAENRLHGLGAADMKGGLAVMIHLLEDEAVMAGAYDVVGVFYEAEEGPAELNSLERILQEQSWLTEATFAVVLEPSDRELQVGCNGVVNATVRFQGRSSHSARPWWGENAVTKAGEWLSIMHQRRPELFVLDGLEYREVMSVTTAQGGVARNIIPPRFDLNLNYRFNPGRTVEDAVEVVRQVCEAADEVEITDTAPAGPVKADHAFVQALRSASGAALAAKQGWTDVARLGVYGVPGVNFGPGEARQAHQADESVDLGDLDFTFDTLQTVLSRTGVTR
jgi:succinyl-diaminopimelate desuccinylase